MAYARHGLRFGGESVSEPKVAQGLVYELDGDAAVQRLVVGEQYGPHGTAAEVVDDADRRQSR